MEGTQMEMFNFLWLIWDHEHMFMVLCSKFAFWVNLHGCYGCQGRQLFLVGVKGR